MIVAEGEGAGAGEAVQVAAAVRALDGQSPRPHRNDRQGAGVGPGGGFARGLAAQDCLGPVARGVCGGFDGSAGVGFRLRTSHSRLL
ncbi:hypothetical protein C1J00_36725 [Streptomyces cahuitamycinicus]|uniref:Uncharacterized protein n=1 Tax=Streptomyces cahuitamycinicus TaxID=2070367 RepID=A0A2N8TEH1_9ACTN|nr:hypothetical protein C1J00_36725 [Streptomyces cahuitamycinicus]